MKASQKNCKSGKNLRQRKLKIFGLKQSYVCFKGVKQ